MLTCVLVTGRSPKGMVFIPFHFAEAAANVLTDNRIDRRARIPDYKVCGVRVAPAAVIPNRAGASTPQDSGRPDRGVQVEAPVGWSPCGDGRPV